MRRPRDWKIGDRITQSRLQEIVNAIRELQNRRPKRPKPSGSVATSDVKPLTLRNGLTEDDIQVVPGTVNTQYPTLGGTSIDADPSPNFTCSAATTYFWIKTVGTFGVTDSYTVTIETTTTSPPPGSPSISDTGFTTYFYIGYVTLASGEITGIFNDYGGGNLGVESFGTVNLWWRK